MQETDLAWAAGFIDGEGSFILSPSRGGINYYITVEATNTDLRPLAKLQAMFGGIIVAHDKGSAKHAQSHKWRANGEIGVSAARAILPYLVIKGEQAAIIIEYSGLTVQGDAADTPTTIARATLKHKLTILNARGPDATERAR